MKKTAICLLLAAHTLAFANNAPMTPQEQSSMTIIRQVYAQQMGRMPTPEEERQVLDTWRKARLPASGARSVSLAPSAEPAATGTNPEDQLAQRIAALGAAKTKVSIEGVRDGLRIDGISYLDPEGQVNTYAFDALTGDITYTIRSGQEVIYKYLRAGSNGDAITLATARQMPNGWQINTVTGKSFSGDAVVPLAKGFMVSRSGSVFRYEPGQTSKGTPVPQGWNMAQFQRGNVGATRYVMLERIQPEQDSSSSLGSLIGAISVLSATAGIGKHEDYALLNLDTGKMYPLNIQADGKLYAQMSNCRRVNMFVSNCATVNSFESLYVRGGDRNYGHYYWKANWYSTPSGPIAITLENGVADIYALDLNSGKKATIFHRTLGIAEFNSSQNPEGIINVAAKLAFERKEVADAAAFLQQAPAETGGAQ